MWTYRKSGLLGESTEGPVTDAGMMDLCHSAKISRATLVAHPKHTNGQWIEAGSIPNFVVKFEAGEKEREAEKQRLKSEKDAQRAQAAQELAAKKKVDAERAEIARAEKKRLDDIAARERLQAAEQQRLAAAHHQQQMALHQQQQYAQQPQAAAQPQYIAAPQQPQTIVINNTQPQSQALPALASFFIPGLGQLIQGRLFSAIAIFVLYCAAVASIFILIGIVLAPLVWIIAIVDAARYQP